MSLTQVVAQLRLDAYALRAPATVARVEPEVMPVKPVAGAAPAVPKEEASRCGAVKPNTETTRPKLTSRKPPVLRKAAAKPIERTEKKPVAPAAIPASLTKTKPLVAVGGDANWETF